MKIYVKNMVTKPDNLSLSWAFLGCNSQFLLSGFVLRHQPELQEYSPEKISSSSKLSVPLCFISRSPGKASPSPLCNRNAPYLSTNTSKKQLFPTAASLHYPHAAGSLCSSNLHAAGSPQKYLITAWRITLQVSPPGLPLKSTTWSFSSLSRGTTRPPKVVPPAKICYNNYLPKWGSTVSFILMRWFISLLSPKENLSQLKSMFFSFCQTSFSF